MLSHPMPSRRLLPLAAALVVLLAACGEAGISIPQSSPHYSGAVLFTQRCSGCHTLSVAGTQGSATNVRTREYKDGPNFDQRKETLNCILYAIRNGGFSGGPMPQDIVTGQDAQKVAEFVAQYSGKQSKRPANPNGNAPVTCPAG
jgi:mono/diheme cytochrome c family protein